MTCSCLVARNDGVVVAETAVFAALELLTIILREDDATSIDALYLAAAGSPGADSSRPQRRPQRALGGR